jgi:hypothetical protein
VSKVTVTEGLAEAQSSNRLSSEGFEAEIAQIVRQLTVLNARQESYREEAVGLQESLTSADRQIALTTDALKRYRQDFSYLAQPSCEDLVCPTCGAQHEESFLSVLTFAEDARALADMVIRLQETRTLLVSRINQSRTEREALAAQYSELQAVLETKRGELKFGGVLKSIGSGVALSALDQEGRDLETARNEHLPIKHRFQQEMKELRSLKKRKAIKAAFQEHYKSARIDEARSRETGGSGLGLAIAKWGAQAHNGELELDCTANTGCIFRLILPLHNGDMPQGACVQSHFVDQHVEAEI